MNHLKGDMADMGMPRFSEFDLLRHRLRAGLLGHARSRQGAHPRHARRICLGRRRLDRLLVRSGRGHGGGAADPAHAVLDLPDPPRAARALLPGDRRLRTETAMRNTGPIKVTKLHPLFGAEVSGIDITRPLVGARVRADPRRLRGAFGPAVPRPADGRREADPVQREFRAARDHRQRQSRRRHQVPAPVEPRHHDRRADPAGRHAHDLPEGQLLLALRLLVQARPLAVLDPDRAHLPARGRQHRVPVHARGVGGAAAGAAGDDRSRWSPSTRCSIRATACRRAS